MEVNKLEASILDLAVSGFSKVEYLGMDHYLHSSSTVWVVFYPNANKPHYQAFKAVEEVPEGRLPWTVDNRRIGKEGVGYPTLGGAIEAASFEYSLISRRSMRL